MMSYHFLLAVLLLCPASSVVASDDNGALPTADDIVSRMAAHDLARQTSIAGYSGKRKYVLENHHFNKRAEMLVDVTGDQDGTKHFEVVSEEGWKAAHKHVLHKMLETESETSRPEMRLSGKLIPMNYDFRVLGTEQVAGRTAYVLEIKPKRTEKYLFRGRIWVDAEDYALARAEGSPAKKPSFWTKNIHFVQVYQKCGSLWFPLSTQSLTEAHLFGSTEVSIAYFGYTPKPLHPADNSVLTAEVMPKR
jgi:hypothetical protein